MKKKTFTLHSQGDLNHVIDFIANLDLKKMWQIVIQSADNRTATQNKLYWATISEIADKKGINKEALHIFFKGAFLPFEEHEVDGNLIQVHPTSKKLTPEEMSIYITQCEVYAMENWNVILERNAQENPL